MQEARRQVAPPHDSGRPFFPGYVQPETLALLSGLRFQVPSSEVSHALYGVLASRNCFNAAISSSVNALKRHLAAPAIIPCALRPPLATPLRINALNSS